MTDTWDFCRLNNKKWGIYPESACNDGIDYFVAETASKDIAQTIIDAVNHAPKWQPIGTAPKDGTPILAYEADWVYPISIRWHQSWGKWVLNGVLLELGDWGQPEVWMPLAAPPTAP